MNEIITCKVKEFVADANLLERLRSGELEAWLEGKRGEYTFRDYRGLNASGNYRLSIASGEVMPGGESRVCYRIANHELAALHAENEALRRERDVYRTALQAIADDADVLVDEHHIRKLWRIAEVALQQAQQPPSEQQA